MENFGGWETIKQLGEGGQSRVFLVRSPLRVEERQGVVQEVMQSNPWSIYESSECTERIARLATSLWKYARPEEVSELGALKKFNIRGSEGQAFNRLKNEIEVLKQNRPGLLRLLGSNESEQWIVTEYCAHGTLESKPFEYKGKITQALKAFRSLVETVASLHKDKIVHRDIKPANVFFGENDTLILGDFGIVFLPDQQERLTVTQERVGPRDFMPQWGDLGGRVEDVHTNFDVYMLGKLLWCMLAGRLKLPREYFQRPAFDLIKICTDPRMKAINAILEKCLVEDPKDCLPSAQQLLPLVDEALASLERPMPMFDERGEVQLPCRICGRGFYQARDEQLDIGNSLAGRTLLRMFVCNVCTHFEFFAPENPEEAARRSWKPWRPN